jgi:hypothetical protein
MGLHQGWKNLVDDGVTNKTWDEYDDLIKAEIADCNRRFASTPGYKDVDWLLVKAMVWVESGGPSNAAWKRRVMQIGNPGDKGYGVLSRRSEGSRLVMTDQLWHEVKVPKRINDPKVNVQAGIAYLFTRTATFDTRSVNDPVDTATYIHVVQKGDNLSTIAASHKTTIASLQELNTNTAVLHPKDVLLYRKARVELVVVGWRTFDTQTIAQRYNVGDADYSNKLNYCLELFKKLKR